MDHFKEAGRSVSVQITSIDLKVGNEEPIFQTDLPTYAYII